MFFDDLVFAREDGGPIDFYIFHFEAEFFGALEMIVNIGVVQENFGGDAAHMQASTAEEGIFFDDGDFQAPLRGANGGDVSARSAADDHDIKFSQTSPPQRLCCARNGSVHGRMSRIADKDCGSSRLANIGF